MNIMIAYSLNNSSVLLRTAYQELQNNSPLRCRTGSNGEAEEKTTRRDVNNTNTTRTLHPTCFINIVTFYNNIGFLWRMNISFYRRKGVRYYGKYIRESPGNVIKSTEKNRKQDDIRWFLHLHALPSPTVFSRLTKERPLPACLSFRLIHVTDEVRCFVGGMPIGEASRILTRGRGARYGRMYCTVSCLRGITWEIWFIAWTEWSNRSRFVFIGKGHFGILNISTHAAKIVTHFP